jgi:two-component system, NarL family, invasion response regulator UvrY
MIKVLLVDDHAIMREGLKQILADTIDIRVAGEAADGFEALKKINALDINVIIMDMAMPGRNGLELLKQIKADKPKLPVLILSMHGEDQYAVRAYRAGASGYITKESASELLVFAIHKVANGGIFISPTAAELMAREFDGIKKENTSPHLSLSNREFQVFKLIVGGKGLTDIAGQLSLSVKTVSTHKTNILEKMHMTTTADLIRYAIKNELLE